MRGDRTSQSESTSWVRLALMTVMLAGVWLLWSGLYKPLLLGLGVLSVLLVLLALQRMEFFSDETFAFRLSVAWLGYWAWLTGEIWRSSIEVSRVALARKVEPAASTVVLDVSEFDPVDQAIIGNSITLTPGTLALDVYQGQITVHALTPGAAEDLRNGGLLQRYRRLRGL